MTVCSRSSASSLGRDNSLCGGTFCRSQEPTVMYIHSHSLMCSACCV